MEESESVALVEECNRLSVKDVESYRVAATKRALVKAGIEYFDALYDPRISEANKHHKALIADKKKFVEPLLMVYDRIGRLLAHFDSEMEARRLQQQREAEREREQEKQRLVDLAREMGAEDAARAIERAPADPTVVAKETPTIEGLHYTETKHYEVVDLRALVKAVACGKAPIAALAYDKGFINKQTHALFDSMDPDKKGVKWLYPGVKIWSSKTPVQKS